MPLEPEQKIAHYEIVAPLGAGGMGEVWRARDTRLGREVAIKGLPEAFARDPERLSRFEREARVLASLNHPNIAAIYGLEQGETGPCLVLELVEGESLAQRLARGPLPVRDALEVGAQIAAAIEAAHDRGVVHRDLKPGNVMLAASRTVKVLDFGLAKGSETTINDAATMAGATAMGLVLGTSSYMSPEQARGQAVDRRTDVWAFGCVLFECLSGRIAFGGPTTSDIMAAVLSREPEWNALGTHVPQRLKDVIRRCLTKDAEDRPRDIGDMRRELVAIEREQSSGARSQSSGVNAVPSLAVLYFENTARDPESEYFCGGITEDILTDLSKLGGLRVASRNAVVRYRGQDVDLARVGSELGVTAVLEGSVRRAGDRVRISAQLVNVSDGFHLWAERYDRKLDDVFAVQEEIAASIAQALKVALTPQEAAQLGQNRPDDARAYDLYLKGREKYNEYREASFREALELFHQALAIDPNYALAWAGVADTHGQLLQQGHGSREENTRLGLEAGKKAIELAPRQPEGYKALALVMRFSGDTEGAQVQLKKGLEADPRYTPILVNLCVYEYCDANLAGAERYIRRAIEVDPEERFALSWLGSLCAFTGRFEEAMTVAHRIAKGTDVTFYVSSSYLIRAYIELRRGDLSALRSLLAEAHERGAYAPAVDAFLSVAAAIEGKLEEADSLLTRHPEAVLGFGSAMAASEAALRLGNMKLAKQFMQKPIMVQLAPTSMRLDAALHALTDEPEFAPRRLDRTLVWPLEAPMIDAARFRMFREMKIESALPER